VSFISVLEEAFGALATNLRKREEELLLLVVVVVVLRLLRRERKNVIFEM